MGFPPNPSTDSQWIPVNPSYVTEGAHLTPATCISCSPQEAFPLFLLHFLCRWSFSDKTERCTFPCWNQQISSMAITVMRLSFLPGWMFSEALFFELIAFLLFNQWTQCKILVKRPFYVVLRSCAFIASWFFINFVLGPAGEKKKKIFPSKEP